MSTKNTKISDFLRPHYAQMSGYVSAGMEVKKNAQSIFLNANENPYELIGTEGSNRYPEPQPVALRERLATLYGVKPLQVAMTRGADEAINILMRMFCAPQQDKILTHSPTFGIYAVGATALDIDVVDIPLIKTESEFALDEQGIIAGGQREDVKLVFLCSPNNPTSGAYDVQVLERITRALEGHAVVVMDETYIEFAQAQTRGSDNPIVSFASRLAEFSNLIILRTLSKSYALAGMRLGAMLCADLEFMDTVRSKGLEIYPLPRSSVEAGMIVTQPETLVQAHENINTILKEKARYVSALRAHSRVSKIYESHANFILLEMDNAHEFCTFCAAHNVYLRDFSSKFMTQNCLRIAVGLLHENDRVLSLLDAFTV